MGRSVVERAREGDREAFALLVGQVIDPLYADTIRILRETGARSVIVVAAALALASCAVAAPSAQTPQPTISSAPSPSATKATPSPTPLVIASASSSPSPVTALEASFQGPRGLAFDTAGNLYVTQCEWTWASIDKIDPKGVVTRFAGTGATGFSGDGGPATAAQLFCAAGVAVGPDGAVYFADHLNNRIRRVDGAGVITTFAGGGPTGLDHGGYSGDGGPAADARLQEPWGVAFDPAGRLYIADRDNVRVRRVDTKGNITTAVGPDAFGCAPVGVAVNADGELVLPDPCTTAIRTVSAAGIITTVAQTESRDSPSDVSSEGNVTFDGAGTMFVQAGPRIFKVESSGAVTAVVGNGRIGVPTDGSQAVDAPMPVEIWGLAFDRAGNLYVADGATSVWRIDTKGVITRFAGKL